MYVGTTSIAEGIGGVREYIHTYSTYLRLLMASKLYKLSMFLLLSFPPYFT